MAPNKLVYINRASTGSMVKKAKMPKNTNIHTRTFLVSLILFVFLDAIRIYTRSSAFGEMSIPQTRQCLWEGICACALERLGMFLTFCFTADASTIESLRLNQGSFEWASFQCIFNSTDISAIKNANSQPALNRPLNGNRVNSSALTRGKSLFPCNILKF